MRSSLLASESGGSVPGSPAPRNGCAGRRIHRVRRRQIADAGHKPANSSEAAIDGGSGASIGDLEPEVDEKAVERQSEQPGVRHPLGTGDVEQPLYDRPAVAAPAMPLLDQERAQQRVGSVNFQADPADRRRPALGCVETLVRAGQIGRRQPRHAQPPGKVLQRRPVDRRQDQVAARRFASTRPGVSAAAHTTAWSLW
jgi:hypothetical protein